MPNMTAALRLNKIPALGLVPESSGTAPTSPVAGQLWTDTSVTPKLVKIWDGSIWAITNIYSGTTSTTYAAGDDSRITGAIQSSTKNVANGVAGLDALSRISTAQLPLVLTAVGQTGAGTTVRFVGGTGAPSAPASGTFVTGDVVVGSDGSLYTCTAGGTPGTWIRSLRSNELGAASGIATLDGTTKVPIAQIPTGTTSTTVPFGNDSRFSDTRTPTAGSVVDASVAAGAAIAETKLSLATDAAAGTGSRRTIGTGSLQAMAGNTNLSTIAAPTANVALGGFKITGLGAPTVSSDAARLADVQAAAAGIDNKPSVRIASTGNVVIATNGLAAVDGVTPIAGDRVLLKNQTTATENGPYVASAGAWTRDTDTVTANSFWFAEEGTTNADTSWMVTTNGAITLGTTSLGISQFGAPGTVSGTASRVTVTGSVIDISASYVGQSSITTVGTLTAGSLGAGFTTITVAQGGTGATSASSARTNLGVAQAGYAATLGAVTAGTPLVVTHNLGTQDVIAQVRDASTNEYVYLDVINASTNTVTITSGIAFSASALRIVILPVA